MSAPPPVRATSTTLTAGTLIAVAFFLVGLGLAAARLEDAARLTATAGVVTLLATPAVGLVVTALELRPLQPRSAGLALLVLAVLAMATLVALQSGP